MYRCLVLRWAVTRATTTSAPQSPKLLSAILLIEQNLCSSPLSDSLASPRRGGSGTAGRLGVWIRLVAAGGGRLGRCCLEVRADAGDLYDWELGELGISSRWELEMGRPAASGRSHAASSPPLPPPLSPPASSAPPPPTALTSPTVSMSFAIRCVRARQASFAFLYRLPLPPDGPGGTLLEASSLWRGKGFLSYDGYHYTVSSALSSMDSFPIKINFSPMFLAKGAPPLSSIKFRIEQDK